MDNFVTIVWLLPIVFMIHDFEEIIAFKPWITRNSPYLKRRFPFLNGILPRMEKMSVQAFALAVFEEFILLVVITFAAVYFDCYYLWMTVFMAFFVHLFVHVVQWIAVRRYIPAIVTTFLVLPYSIYGCVMILESNLFTVQEIITGALAGVVLMVVNLIAAHSLARRFDKWFLSNIKFFIY